MATRGGGGESAAAVCIIDGQTGVGGVECSRWLTAKKGSVHVSEW